MKVIKTIKIDKSNIEEISSLECVDGFEWWHDDTLVVRLRPEFTKGRQTLMDGDFLCQFESGLWQRFGAEALNRISRTPGREAGERW